MDTRKQGFKVVFLYLVAMLLIFQYLVPQIFISQSTDFPTSQSTDFPISQSTDFPISQSTDFPFRKVQISHFAKYRFPISQSTDFPLRKVQISYFAKYRFPISQSTDFPFRFVPFRFAKYNKPCARRAIRSASYFVITVFEDQFSSLLKFVFFFYIGMLRF